MKGVFKNMVIKFLNVNKDLNLMNVISLVLKTELHNNTEEKQMDK